MSCFCGTYMQQREQILDVGKILNHSVRWNERNFSWGSPLSIIIGQALRKVNRRKQQAIL